MNLINLSLSQSNAELILRGLIELPFKEVNVLVHYIDNEITHSRRQMPANTVTVAPAQTYKYGLKKDGTPRKSPGRPPKKVTS
jgi:hypothetical protein